MCLLVAILVFHRERILTFKEVQRLYDPFFQFLFSPAAVGAYVPVYRLVVLDFDSGRRGRIRLRFDLGSPLCSSAHGLRYHLNRAVRLARLLFLPDQV
jgi:hypothetical protein